MKRLRIVGVLTATLVFSGLSLAQVLTPDNPFPESATQSQSLLFDTSKTVTLVGNISQEISRPTSNLSYLFFRIVVNGTTWTIQIHDQQLRNLAQLCDTCLGDDYTPEMSRIKTGTLVTVKGYESKQHDHRLLLIPVSGRGTTAGMILNRGNN
jgi:hypothetical protein